jgi:hypothetical protein
LPNEVIELVPPNDELDGGFRVPRFFDFMIGLQKILWLGKRAI